MHPYINLRLEAEYTPEYLRTFVFLIFQMKTTLKNLDVRPFLHVRCTNTSSNTGAGIGN